MWLTPNLKYPSLSLWVYITLGGTLAHAHPLNVAEMSRSAYKMYVNPLTQTTMPTVVIMSHHYIHIIMQIIHIQF
jgi:hypothetical protein